jgi:hypothetical protein
MEINVQDFEPGIFLISVEMGGKIEWERVVIQ